MKFEAAVGSFASANRRDFELQSIAESKNETYISQFEGMDSFRRRRGERNKQISEIIKNKQL